MGRLVAIDPGSKKCGLVLTDPDEAIVLDGRVVSVEAVLEVILHWHKESPLDGIYLGNGTTSNHWHKLLPSFLPIELVEERGSTIRARERYWQLWPPRSWRRWVPKGLLMPSQPLDAVAALVLLEDHLGQKFTWPGPPSFKTLP